MNCLLPLFDDKDEDLGELLNTRLVKFMISFLVTNNVDYIHEEAYLSLICSVLQTLMTEPQSNARDTLFHRCIKSVQIFYSRNK